MSGSMSDHPDPQGIEVGGGGAPEPGDAGPHEAVEHPDKLLRIAGMVHSMLAEVETTTLDEPSRERLSELHNSILDALRELLSGELRDELAEFRFDVEEEGTPSGTELRVVQAQLAGWLQGLFQGIQASIASQQLAAQQQLAQLRRQQLPGGQQPSEDPSGRGQYL